MHFHLLKLIKIALILENAFSSIQTIVPKYTFVTTRRCVVVTVAAEIPLMVHFQCTLLHIPMNANLVMLLDG